jgi:predicted permease
MSIRSKLRTLVFRRKAEREMAEEMRLHLEMLTERNVSVGMSEEEARFAARREFGGVEQVKEICREQRFGVLIETWWRDLRQAWRGLVRTPVFAGAVIATLALCLGPCVAILTLLYALVLKSQPFREPQRLVQVFNAFDAMPGGPSRQNSSPSQYQDFQANADLFEGFAMMQYFGTTIGEETTPERGMGMRVDAGFFSLLGVQPLLGRFARADENVVGRDNVLVLTETFWRSRYAANADVVGRVIRINGEPWTIIGVAPKSVEGLDPFTMFFKPFEAREEEKDAQARYRGRTNVFGRLKPGVTLEAAQAQLAQIDRRHATIEASAPVRAYLEQTGHHVVLERLGEAQAAAVRSPLALLQGGALFVLLIGVVNALNLILARANARRPEFAVRAALGASRGRLLRQLFAETLLLTAVACVLALALAWASLHVINRYLPLVAAKALPVTLDAPVVALIVAVSAVLALGLAVVPFALLGKSGLRLGVARTASASATARRCGHAMVVMQVAVALVLLVGAGLLVRSFARVLSVELGFDAQQIVQARIAVTQAHTDPEKNVALQRRVMTAFREIPGVEKVSVVTVNSIGSFPTVPFVLRGGGELSGSQSLAALNWVSPDYFDTMGVRLLEGRVFTEADDRRKDPVVIVDDLFVKRYFPGRNAVGEEIAIGANPPPEGVPWPRIVGVVRRAQLAGPEGRDGLPFIYRPFVQESAPGLTFLVRSPRPASQVLTEMRQKMSEIDPTMPLYWTTSLKDGIDDMLQFRRGLLLLVAVFAGLALLLAGVGLYGVLAYDVSQRTREIGIRGALGATRGQIVSLILKQGLGRACMGLAAGLVASIFLTRLLRSWLFDVTPGDPVAIGGVTLLLMGVALLASWLPARRAARVDPMVALRAE